MDKPTPVGTFALEVDVETFGKLLARGSFPILTGLPLRNDGISCPDCGTFVTWSAGACDCGWQM